MTLRPFSPFFPLAVCSAAITVLWFFAELGAGHKNHDAMALAKKATKGDIIVLRPWARASAGRAYNGAAYFTILNRGTRADRLIGSNTLIAKKAELHEHRMADGIMRMREVKGGLAISAGGKLSFAPRGYHVMLAGLAKPLKAGEGFMLTLVFERAGRITIHVVVHPIGGAPKLMPMPRH